MLLHLQSLLQGKPDITLCCIVGKWCSGKLHGVYVYVLGVLHVCTWMHAHFVLLCRYTVCNILAVTMSRLFSHFCLWIALFATRYLQFTGAYFYLSALNSYSVAVCVRLVCLCFQENKTHFFVHNSTFIIKFQFLFNVLAL